MSQLYFSFVNTWFFFIILIFLFFINFLKSFSMFSVLLTNSPHFKRRKTKYVEQSLTFFKGGTTVSFLSFFLLCYHNIFDLQINWPIKSFLLLSFFILYYFINTLEIAVLSYKTNEIANINSSGLFLGLFVPATALTITANNLLDFVLPFEVLSYLFYFIFLEFSYTEKKTEKLIKNWTKTLMRGFMYYFWLSFIGTVFFIFALYITSVYAASTEFVHLFPAQTQFDGVFTTPTLIGGLIITALLIKMGGLFFFFFKAELYKLLPSTGVVIFSVFTTFFYLTILFGLLVKAPYLLFAYKWIVTGSLTVSTIIFIFLYTIKIINFYLFVGISSVLTVFFTFLIFV